MPFSAGYFDVTSDLSRRQHSVKKLKKLKVFTRTSTPATPKGCQGTVHIDTQLPYTAVPPSRRTTFGFVWIVCYRIYALELNNIQPTSIAVLLDPDLSSKQVCRCCRVIDKCGALLPATRLSSGEAPLNKNGHVTVIMLKHLADSVEHKQEKQILCCESALLLKKDLSYFHAVCALRSPRIFNQKILVSHDGHRTAKQVFDFCVVDLSAEVCSPEICQPVSNEFCDTSRSVHVIQ